MKTRTKVATASIALGVLTLTGGTFALWSDSVTIPGQDIVAGHLDLAIDDLVAYDVSTLQRPTGAGAEATTANWAVIDGTPTEITTDFLFVPGDIVRIAVPITVDLAGNNLLAELDVTLTDEAAANGFTVTGRGIVDAADAEDAVASDAVAESRLFTPGDEDDVYAVYEIAFDDTDTNGITAGDKMDASLEGVLGETEITLVQVRPTPSASPSP